MGIQRWFFNWSSYVSIFGFVDFALISVPSNWVGYDWRGKWNGSEKYEIDSGSSNHYEAVNVSLRKADMDDGSSSSSFDIVNAKINQSESTGTGFECETWQDSDSRWYKILNKIFTWSGFYVPGLGKCAPGVGS